LGDIELSASISDKNTMASSNSSSDQIDYETALSHSGGFGAYQAIMLLALSIFNIYGDVIIFNFVYLTSPFKFKCEGGQECTQQLICENSGQPNTEDKDYIYGFTAATPEMNCWSE
jgi:hypothetical protein